MKTKFLVSVIALLAIMSFVATSVLATGDLDVSITNTNVNGVDMGSKTVVDYAGATLVIRTEFVVNTDYSGVDGKVKVWIGGEEAEASVKNLALTTGTHSQYLVIKVPTDLDQTEIVSLYVRVEAGSDYQEAEYNLQLQRETYDLKILDVDNDKTVNAGASLAVTVVLKNNGYREMKDVFVVVSVPELGIDKKVYFEDLSTNDTCDECNGKDSAERTVTLKIPTNAKAGVYDMKVEAYNAKTSSVVTRSIVVVGSEDASRVVVPVASKDMNTGETVSYDIIIVNSGSKVGVYEIVPEANSGVTMSTNTPVITIPAGASQTVTVDVKATREGSYNLGVGVTSDNQLVQRVSLIANVDSKVFTGNVAVLTIILAIVFVVLLIVLIVLLTRKPMKSEELEESYY